MPVSYKRLFKLLIDRDLKKDFLRKTVGLSPSTVAKMGKGEYVSLEVIDRICVSLGVDISEIVELNEDYPRPASWVNEPPKD